MASTNPNQSGGDSANIGETAMFDTNSETALAETGASKKRLPGDTFGRYRIQKTLGEGAMGSVYLAHDTQLHRKVALKMPKFDRAEAKHIERFMREARSAATLSHPNICQVFDVGQIDGTHFMTMAYVQGHTLQDFVNPDRPQRDRNVANVVRKIALALHEAHTHGLVHRDVKPSNIMIDQRNEPIIMDFGLARQMDENDDARLTRDGAILGSPAYMSPEQVEGKYDKLGPRSDIYSLGVIMYELLTGYLPFQGSVAAIIGQILSKEPESPITLRSDMSPRLAEICMKAMAKRPQDRYPSMQPLANELLEFLKAKPEDDKPANLEMTGVKKKHEPDASTDTDAGLRLNANISVTCTCGQKLVAKKELAGKTVRCPRCNNVLLLPGARQLDVSCGSCGQRFMAREDLAGKVVKCPMCTRPMKVPHPGIAQMITQQIDVTCTCGQQFVATPDLAGRRVKCTACGSAILVPRV